MNWRKWQMRSPVCGYQYYVELNNPTKLENCPICNYQAPFDEFIVYEVEQNEI